MTMKRWLPVSLAGVVLVMVGCAQQNKTTAKQTQGEQNFKQRTGMTYAQASQASRTSANNGDADMRKMLANYIRTQAKDRNPSGNNGAFRNDQQTDRTSAGGTSNSNNTNTPSTNKNTKKNTNTGDKNTRKTSSNTNTTTTGGYATGTTPARAAWR